MASQEVLRLQKKIHKQLHRFELFALLDLLEYMGYENHEILFKCNFSMVSEAHFVHSIEFVNHPRDRVVINVNYGLLTGQSPLPSYFFKMIDTAYVEEDPFVDFLDFFNHFIVRNYVMSLRPERDLQLYPDWLGTKRCYLDMASISSTTTLKWLFDTIFPELDVSVSYSRLVENLTIDTITMGHTVLGSSAVFGSRSNIPVTGYQVTIYCEEEFRKSGQAWARVIENRLDNLVFPLLKDSEIYLRIYQIIRSQKSEATLGPSSYLGYDKIPGGRKQQRRIVLFEGRVEKKT